MAKAALQHACSECGYTTGKWLGRCPACGEWGTPGRGARARAGAGRPRRRGRAGRCSGSSRSRRADAERIPTGVAELDRVLGGGLVPASLVLVSGDPGIGKSTLLLMALRAMSAGAEGRPRHRRGVRGAGEAPRRPAGRRRRRPHPRRDEPRRGLRDARARAARGLRRRLRPDALRARARLGARLGRPGARGGRPLPPRGQGAGRSRPSSSAT